MNTNLNSESNLLAPSTRRNLFKGMATGLVAGSVAGPAILSGAKKPKQAGVRKGRINQSVVPGVLLSIGARRKPASMQKI
jgi:hypothetical protein